MIIIKQCSDCGNEKELTEFYNQNKTRKDATKYIYYQPYCKECAINRSKKYQKDNKEWTVEYSKKSYKRKEQYFKDKAKRWSKNNKEKHKNQQKEWRKNHPNELKGYREDRNQHKKHEISDEELCELYIYADNSCMYCGITEEKHKELYGQKLHKDHAINDGSNKIDNCILACKSCNSSKRDNDWYEWYSENNVNYTDERYVRISEWLNKFTI